MEGSGCWQCLSKLIYVSVEARLLAGTELACPSGTLTLTFTAPSVSYVTNEEQRIDDRARCSADQIRAEQSKAEKSRERKEESSVAIDPSAPQFQVAIGVSCYRSRVLPRRTIIESPVSIPKEGADRRLDLGRRVGREGKTRTATRCLSALVDRSLGGKVEGRG